MQSGSGREQPPQLSHQSEEVEAEEEEGEEEESRLRNRTEPVPSTSASNINDNATRTVREREVLGASAQVQNNLLLLAENVRRFRNFGLEGREASFRIRTLPEGVNVYNWLENVFRDLHSYATQSCEPGDYVGLSFDSENLRHGPAGISFRPVRDLTYENIWGLVSALAQSSGGLDVAQSFNIRVFKITPPMGRGRNVNSARDLVAKRSILTISNSDNLCLPRALVSALVFNERGNLRTGGLHEKWNAVRKQNSPLQREIALQLARDAGVTIPEEGCGIPEIVRFQQYLAENNIMIVVDRKSVV